MVVASTAAFTEDVQPMKNRPNSKVDGNPAINPPIFDPSLSASTVTKITHNPPIAKERKSLIRKGLFTNKIIAEH